MRCRFEATRPARCVVGQKPRDALSVRNYEYDLKDLSTGRDHLAEEVADWANEVHAAQVGRLLGT
jgi:hypothetical protein